MIHLWKFEKEKVCHLLTWLKVDFLLYFLFKNVFIEPVSNALTWESYYILIGSMLADYILESPRFPWCFAISWLNQSPFLSFYTWIDECTTSRSWTLGRLWKLALARTYIRNEMGPRAVGSSMSFGWFFKIVEISRR